MGRKKIPPTSTLVSPALKLLRDPLILHSKYLKTGAKLDSGFADSLSESQLTDIGAAKRLLRMRRGAAAGFCHFFHSPKKQYGHSDKTAVHRPGHLQLKQRGGG